MSAPFGIGRQKPHHYRSMLRVVWQNRDNLRYAWRVLTRGVCDGCALGTSGIRDWTLDGDVHLCAVRLELLRFNTMPALDPAVLKDVSALQAMSGRELRDLGRLPYPMRRDKGDAGFRRISWDDALAFLGQRIGDTDPDRLCFYMTSKGITNETYYVAQKAARYLGTPHIENSARLCHSPSAAGMGATLGVGASTVSYKDWIGTDLLVFFGTNFPNDQPVATKYVDLAKKAGTRVLAVNSYREPGLQRYWIPSNTKSALFGTEMAERFFSVHQGGDLAFLCAVQKRVHERGATNKAFVDAHADGWDAFEAQLSSFDLDELIRLAGSSRDDVEAFVDAICAAEDAIFVWSMGITQHAHGADTVMALCNLAIMRGYLGRPHAGVVPIRGHSGVQGGAEMGAYATVFPGGPIDEDNAARLESVYGFPVPARKGYTTVDILTQAAAGEVDILYFVGGNLPRVMPNPALVEQTLARIPLRIHQDIMLNHSMFIEPEDAVVLLPSRTRYEQRDGGTETTTERRVIFSPYIPGHDIGEARSEWEILQDVAAAAKPEMADKMVFESGQAIRREIAEVIPKYKGIETLEKKGDMFQWGGRILCKDGVTPLPGGKTRLKPVRPPEIDVAAGQFRLGTRRGSQFNSMIHHESDPLTGAGRLDIFMSAEDAESLELVDGAPIVLESAHGTFDGFVKIAPIRPGNLQGHWPEVNGLIPEDRVDPKAFVPDYNALVTVRAR